MPLSLDREWRPIVQWDGRECDLVMANDQTLLENLEYAVKRARTDLQAAEESHKQLQERLSHATALLEFERKRIGTMVTTQSGRYAGMALRRAIIEILRNGVDVMTRQAVIDQLMRNGVTFESKTPGRAVHAALIGVEEVEKVDGSYRWLGEIDLSRSSKVESVRSDGQ